MLVLGEHANMIIALLVMRSVSNYLSETLKCSLAITEANKVEY